LTPPRAIEPARLSLDPLDAAGESRESVLEIATDAGPVYWTLLPAGRYTLRLGCPGHAAQSREVSIRDATVHERFELGD
jgi:hypothetical protein